MSPITRTTQASLPFPTPLFEYAECWLDWEQEITQFKTCLEAWFLTLGQDRNALLNFMRQHRWRTHFGPKNLFVEAKCKIILDVNTRLSPVPDFPEACYLKRCAQDQLRAGKLPSVAYQLSFSLSDATTSNGTPIVPLLVATSVVSAIWLQLAELMISRRVVRQCERCHQYMDITDSPRRGAKRMHERRSLAARMARYRQKKSEGLS